MAVFHLSKWYLDCVTDSGNTSIVYVGDLRWGPVHLHYSSLLRSVGTQVSQQNSLRQPTLPVLGDQQVSWDSTQFDFSAVWRACSKEVGDTVFASQEGSVQWRCLMPRARTCLTNDSGLGYVEHLTMTLPPWKIPIQHLRWGRFLSASDWAVWMEWQGEYSTSLVYRNGSAVPATAIDDAQISFADGSRLTIDRSLTLRKGPLGTTALSSIPALSKTFPARLLQVNECKWRSRGRLECPGRAPIGGWVIHELVSWPT